MRNDPKGQRARELLAEQKYRAKRDGISIEEVQTRSVRFWTHKSANAAYLEFVGMPYKTITARIRERELKNGIDPNIRKIKEKKSYIAWRHHEAKTNPLRGLLRPARARAKKFGIEFSITEAELLMDGEAPKFCPVFGVELNYLKGNRKVHDNSASLDRIDNTIGYVPGNVVVVCWRANAIKRDATLKEIQQIAVYMHRFQKPLKQT